MPLPERLIHMVRTDVFMFALLIANRMAHAHHGGVVLRTPSGEILTTDLGPTLHAWRLQRDAGSVRTWGAA